jgi:hypothetical protein
VGHDQPYLVSMLRSNEEPMGGLGDMNDVALPHKSFLTAYPLTWQFAEIPLRGFVTHWLASPRNDVSRVAEKSLWQIGVCS